MKQNQMRAAYLKGNCGWAGKATERISFTQLFFQDCSGIHPEIAFSETQQHSSHTGRWIFFPTFLAAPYYHIILIITLSTHSCTLHPSLPPTSSKTVKNVLICLGYITNCLCPTFRMFYQKDVIHSPKHWK